MMPAWIDWLFPAEASTLAPKVDYLFLFLLLVCVMVASLIFLTILVFIVRYRRRSPDQVGAYIPESIVVEIIWFTIPLVIFLATNAWGAILFYDRSTPPEGSLEIYVVAKQWMWKLQHPEGTREINELHVPVDVPVRLVMTSQDVIHDFYVPAFRIKQDVLPARYTSQWFQATKPGRYHLFCAQLCGAQHSRMRGWVQVMSQSEYEDWMDSQRISEPMLQSGQKLFSQLGCSPCHGQTGTRLGPTLFGIYGRSIPQEGGGMIVCDENYLQKSILNPDLEIVKGYKPGDMPSYQNRIGEEEMNMIIEYVKSLK